MIKWYLVLYYLGNGVSLTTIPQPYSSKLECLDAGNTGGNLNFQCIKGPKININLNVNSNNQGNICTEVVLDKILNTFMYVAVPCEDKGYVCQPGATTCEVVK